MLAQISFWLIVSDCLPVDFDIRLLHPGKSLLCSRVGPPHLPVSKKNWSIIPNPSVLVLLLVVVLVFVLVTCCCCCFHRLHCCIANTTDAAVDTKCTAAIIVTIAPAVAAIITIAIALTAAIAALVASVIAPCCNHCHLAVALAVAVVVARVVARLVVVAAAAAAAAAAMSGCQWQRTCAASVEGCRSNDIILLGLRCSAWLALLGLLCLACIKARLLTLWLALRAPNAG
jgi:hypothetical protein